MRNLALTAITAAIAWTLGSAGAHAQTIAVNGGAISAVQVQVPVRASVSSSCGFAASALPNGTRNLGDVSNAFTHDFSFQLQCSGPVRVGIQSANGGLRATGPAPATGYTQLAPYEVVLRLVGNTGVPQAEGACAAALLVPASGTCGIRGAASPTQGLRLSGASQNVGGSFVRVRSSGYTGQDILVASTTYADTLTVTLSPAS